jgi:hypothetical protein
MILTKVAFLSEIGEVNFSVLNKFQKICELHTQLQLLYRPMNISHRQTVDKKILDEPSLELSRMN